MKLQKNKIVFVLVLVCVVLFITAYSLLTFGKEQEPELNMDQIPLPDLEESPKAYEIGGLRSHQRRTRDYSTSNVSRAYGG